MLYLPVFIVTALPLGSLSAVTGFHYKTYQRITMLPLAAASAVTIAATSTTSALAAGAATDAISEAEPTVRSIDLFL